jgi:hypothetical protein
VPIHRCDQNGNLSRAVAPAFDVKRYSTTNPFQRTIFRIEPVFLRFVHASPTLCMALLTTDAIRIPRSTYLSVYTLHMGVFNIRRSKVGTSTTRIAIGDITY